MQRVALWTCILASSGLCMTVATKWAARWFRNPHIKAVGFTGSLCGGRALFDLCAARDETIPFFDELGSVNPIFLLPEALSARGDEIARGWAAPLTMGAGQFCTNPGIAFVLAGPDAEAFIAATARALEDTAADHADRRYCGRVPRGMSASI